MNVLVPIGLWIGDLVVGWLLGHPRVGLSLKITDAPAPMAAWGVAPS